MAWPTFTQHASAWSFACVLCRSYRTASLHKAIMERKTHRNDWQINPQESRRSSVPMIWFSSFMTGQARILCVHVLVSILTCCHVWVRKVIFNGKGNKIFKPHLFRKGRRGLQVMPSRAEAWHIVHSVLGWFTFSARNLKPSTATRTENINSRVVIVRKASVWNN